MKGATAAAGPACSGMRSLSGVLESQRVIRAARAASLAGAADCVYTSTAGGRVTSHPIDRRTETRVYFGGCRYLSRQRLERDGCVHVTDGPLAEMVLRLRHPRLGRGPGRGRPAGHAA